ncbi:MAG TPA: threonine aldolase family protein, partial [Gemmataceae bacterium]|nr:threonine aldolase family protein [Gemmataceae bacterium]
MPETIDLRSDTVTRPTPAMRAAMQAAELGDDVFGEDPTVNRLQERVADLLGKEAALYVPSGTMSNQVCVKAHTQPGDELLCEATCHIYNFEAGGPAVLSGVTCRTLEGDYGIVDVSQLDGKVRAVNDHLVRTRLVCLENTHNRGGGRVYPLEKIQAISGWAHQQGLMMHLDGARLWNAVVATGIPAGEWAR